MSIALVVTRGYGNGTLEGDIAHVVTRGYSIGSTQIGGGGGGGALDMGEEVRTKRKHEDTVRTELLKSMGEYIDVIPIDPIVKGKRVKYDESDDIESIMWLQ